MNNRELKMDPKFRDKIPPLTDEEFKQLEENIVEAGEIYEPIAVWNGVIIDGHNRYKIAQMHPEVKWTTRSMEFVDEWAAYDWMYRNQLGRRNVTDEQRTYMIGKMYEARKNTAGGDRKSKQFSSSQNENLKTNGRTPRTDEIIGKELGVNHSTVVRAEKFAKGIDALHEVSPEASDKVLRGEAKVTKKDVFALPEILSSEQRGQAIEAILVDKSLSGIMKQIKESKSASTSAQMEHHNQLQSTFNSTDNKQQQHEPIDDIPVNYVGNSAYNREMLRITNEIAKQLADVDAPSTYNMDDLIEELKFNGDKAVKIAKNTVELRRNLLVSKEEKARVKRALVDIINQFREVVKSV